MERQQARHARREGGVNLRGTDVFEERGPVAKRRGGEGSIEESVHGLLTPVLGKKGDAVSEFFGEISGKKEKSHCEKRKKDIPSLIRRCGVPGEAQRKMKS